METHLDIVERLRLTVELGLPDRNILEEAADEIERLRTLKTPASRELLNITKGCLDSAEAEIQQHLREKIELAGTVAKERAEIERLRCRK